MKLHHAAALALLGWYIILPPTGPEHRRGNVNAPLKEWVRRPTTYLNHDECQHVLDKYRLQRKMANKQIQYQYYQQAQCVSADDPRLK